MELEPDLKQILSKSNKTLSSKFLNSFLRLTDHTVWHYIFQWQTSNDPILSKLCKDLINRNLYKSISTSLVDQMEFYRKVFDLEKTENIDLEYVFSEDSPSTSYYKGIYITHGSKDDEKDLEKEASEQIFLFDSNGNGFELSSKSNIIKQIRNETLKISRFYFPKKYKNILTGG